MRDKLYSETLIPEGVEARLEGDCLIVKGAEGEISRKFKPGRLNALIKDGKIIFEIEKGTKTEKRMINTLSAHVRNMIKGVQEKFEYQIKICFGHFPFTVKQNGDKVIIKNFLGEKIEREVKIPQGAELDIGKEIIKIKSVDKEIAGQAAANFEAATRIKKKDKRVFQDGIYIINKAGKEI